MTDLYRRSVELILENQAPTGAYLASPNFRSYRYSWFRDGSYIAYAMDLAGRLDSAARFHDWAARAILRRADVVERAIAKTGRNEPLEEEDILHTRYTVEGEAVDGKAWPNFQLDGFGTWLWALGEHVGLVGTQPTTLWREAASLAADYLAALWRRPCYDCWEEFPEKVHTYSLAAIHGGLRAHQQLWDGEHQETLEAIGAFLRERAVSAGRFVKSTGTEEVDGSLLGLATPYRVVDPRHPLMVATVEDIERTLRDGGGVHRYRADTFYGGGEWILLTAWLAWYRLEVGEQDRASELIAWVENQSDETGQLPEQVPSSLNDPSLFEPWRRRWGEIAKPLLWSHASYIIARRGSWSLTP